jgi:hypothetical protein
MHTPVAGMPLVPKARRGPRYLTADLWCEGALRFENAKSRLEYCYVKIGSDPTAFKLRSGCYISRYSGDHHANVGIGHKAHCNPLLLLGYAQ